MVRMFLQVPFLVKRDEFVYKITSMDIVSNQKPQHLVNLELVCGWDYMDADTVGWCEAIQFNEHVRYEILPHYFVEESLVDAFKNRGYEVIEDASEFIDFL